MPSVLLSTYDIRYTPLYAVHVNYTAPTQWTYARIESQWILFSPDKPKFIHNTIKFTQFNYNFNIILVKSAAFWEYSQISFAVLFKVNSNFICNNNKIMKEKEICKKKQRTKANECEEEGNLSPLDFSLCVYMSVPLCMVEFIWNKAVSMFRFLYYNRYLNGNCQTSKQTSGKTSNSANHICNWGKENSAWERER